MTRLQIPPDVGTVDVGDTAYAARLPDGPIVVLDGVAAVIWDLLRSEPCDLKTLTGLVSKQLIDPPAGLADTITAFIAELRAQHLVTALD